MTSNDYGLLKAIADIVDHRDGAKDLTLLPFPESEIFAAPLGRSEAHVPG